MNDDQHNPNGESTPLSPGNTAIDRIRTGTRDAYPRAHRAARSTLETIGIDRGGSPLQGEEAERLVSLVLGAALLELEVPWRHVLEGKDRDLAGSELAVGLLENKFAETRRRCDDAEAALNHRSENEHKARKAADAASDLATRLENDLDNLVWAAGVVLDQSADEIGPDGRVKVRSEALDRLAQNLKTLETLPDDAEETDR